jgi:hypothetical protein
MFPEGQFDSCTEQLFEVSLKLEEKEKAYNNTEGDVGGLSRRALLLEEDVERYTLQVQQLWNLEKNQAINIFFA